MVTLTFTAEEFAKKRGAIFVECDAILAGEPYKSCKYSKHRVGGTSYELTEEMWLALLTPGKIKELQGRCQYCGNRFVIRVSTRMSK